MRTLERAQYELRNGSYYFLRKTTPNPVTNPDGEEIILMTDQIAIAFDTSMSEGEAVLLKHGAPEYVESWVETARKSYLSQKNAFASEMAQGLRTILLPRGFPVEEMNHLINNTSYLTSFLKKNCPQALESDQ